MDAERFYFPGKVFVLGEYAVLANLPAVVAAFGPEFQVSVSVPESVSESPFHPRSPAFLLQKWMEKSRGLPKLGFRFDDPYAGKGGFGASTAQFAGVFRAYRGPGATWRELWELYRELTRGQGPTNPSGADLVAQWTRDVILFEPQKRQVTSLESALDWSCLLVFSATHQPGRKVATHQHLSELTQISFSSLEGPLLSGIEAIQSGDWRGLGQSMDDYAHALLDLGLEVAATTEDRQYLRKLPGVVGVKGAGALQSDAILVLVEPGITEEHRNHRNQMIRAAELRGLTLISVLRQRSLRQRGSTR